MLPFEPIPAESHRYQTMQTADWVAVSFSAHTGAVTPLVIRLKRVSLGEVGACAPTEQRTIGAADRPLR